MARQVKLKPIDWVEFSSVLTDLCSDIQLAVVEWWVHWYTDSLCPDQSVNLHQYISTSWLNINHKLTPDRSTNCLFYFSLDVRCKDNIQLDIISHTATIYLWPVIRKTISIIQQIRPEIVTSKEYLFWVMIGWTGKIKYWEFSDHGIKRKNLAFDWEGFWVFLGLL